MELTASEGNPIPANSTVGSVKTKDGVSLRWARFAPTGGGLKGTVTLVQGRAEFIEKYFEVISELQARGFYVVTFDLRGQGGSQRLLPDPLRGHVDSFDEYVTDLLCIMEEVVLSNCPGPHYLLAHSTGGAVALLAHKRLKTMIDRAVFSSPLIELEMNRRALRASRLLAQSLIWIGMNGRYVPGGNSSLYCDFEENKQTSDERRFKRMVDILKENPSLGVGSPTIGWFHACSRALAKFKEERFGFSLDVPSLVITAGADRIVSSDAAEELCRTSPALGFLQVRGSNHEIMMERDWFREQFWAAFDAFIPGAGD
ncbi:alpha/beta hydrolase [Rhodobacteraceae bacterium RKSG542]|nr:alpha/beta hydrolase [Pseudovibrio flavus]